MSPNVAFRRWQLAVRLTGAALIWSVGLVVAAFIVPVYDGQTLSNSQGPDAGHSEHARRPAAGPPTASRPAEQLERPVGRWGGRART